MNMYTEAAVRKASLRQLYIHLDRAARHRQYETDPRLRKQWHKMAMRAVYNYRLRAQRKLP